MDSFSEYWNQIYKGFLSKKSPSDSDCLRVVCYSGWPLLFNRVMDFFERHLSRQMLKKFPVSLRGKTVLDIGCGTGRWCQFFGNYGSRVIGTDLFHNLLAFNQKHFPRFSFCVMDACWLAVKNSSIDWVSAGIVLQHIPLRQKSQAIDEISRVLRPGGGAVIIESVSREKYREGQTAALLRTKDWEALLQASGIHVLAQSPLHAYPLASLYQQGKRLIAILIKSMKAFLRKFARRSHFVIPAEAGIHGSPLKSCGDDKTLYELNKRGISSDDKNQQNGNTKTALSWRHQFYHALDQFFLGIIACLSVPLEFLWIAFQWEGSHRIYLVQKLQARPAEPFSANRISNSFTSFAEVHS